MSRIYEALQRAESEQQALSGGHPIVMQPSEVSNSSDWGLAGEPDAESLSFHANLAGRVGPSPSTAPIVDISLLQKHSWNPSLDNLPAFLREGAIVEQFQSLRSRLFELRNQVPFKSLLISSGLPNEGKSFIAANLAVSLARHQNSKVLLVDGDMRHATLHAVLGCDSRPGLSEYLSGRASIVEIIQAADNVQNPWKLPPQVLDNLAFVAAGDSRGEAADLSGSPLFAELIAAMAPSFDWIVVDSSSVIFASDAVNLARGCDAVLLVARGGVTPFQVAQRVQHEMKASRILGVVLNGANSAVVGRHCYRSSFSGRPQASDG